MVRILVIEDDDQQRSAMCRMLVRAGHDVSQAADGAQGLALFRREPVDLVVTDIFMPEADGFEVIQILKRDVPDLPILAVSGGTTRMRLGEEYIPSILRTAVRFGASHALRKPFEEGEFLRAVDALVTSRPETHLHKDKSGRPGRTDTIADSDPGADDGQSHMGRASWGDGSIPGRLGDPDPAANHVPASAAGLRPEPSDSGSGAASPAEGHGETAGGQRSGSSSSSASPSGRMEALAMLTAKERQVVEALLAGVPLPRIAREGGRSPRTIRNELASVFRKLGVHSQVELLAHLRGW